MEDKTRPIVMLVQSKISKHSKLPFGMLCLVHAIHQRKINQRNYENPTVKCLRCRYKDINYKYYVGGVVHVTISIFKNTQNILIE